MAEMTPEERRERVERIRERRTASMLRCSHFADGPWAMDCPLCRTDTLLAEVDALRAELYDHQEAWDRVKEILDARCPEGHEIEEGLPPGFLASQVGYFACQHDSYRATSEKFKAELAAATKRAEEAEDKSLALCRGTCWDWDYVDPDDPKDQGERFRELDEDNACSICRRVLGGGG